jgi:hypothetical protein
MGFFLALVLGCLVVETRFAYTLPLLNSITIMRSMDSSEEVATIMAVDKPAKSAMVTAAKKVKRHRAPRALKTVRIIYPVLVPWLDGQHRERVDLVS